MYKLLALDIDGTLVNSKGSITLETLEAIQNCMEKNIMVTISTGRPIQGVKKFIDELKLKAPIITYNGAMIVDSVTGNILFEQGLSKKDGKQIIELGRKMDATMSIWSNNKLYVNRINENINNYKKLSENEPIVISEYEKIFDQGITKILWIDSIEKIDEYKKSIYGIVNKTVNYCTSKPIYLEFFDGKVSKADALGFIGEKYNIYRSEIIAIGDGFNDLSMIEYAGLGVAMGNAPGEVKEKADFVTSSNDDDGIVKVIKKFIL